MPDAVFTCRRALKAVYYKHGKREENNTAEPRIRGKSRQVITGYGKIDVCQFHFGGILKGQLPQYIVIAAGIIFFVIFAAAGLIFASQKKNRGELCG